MDRREALETLTAGTCGIFLPWQNVNANSANLKGYLRTNWSRDPYALGSYSYYSKDAKPSDRKTLGASIDARVYFAGEAVHPEHTSTVHAAYESGLTVAKRVSLETTGHIAIIGAGISGLSAAHSLVKNNRKVSVYEVRDRIGGRIWTSSALGSPLDLGASWIHGALRNPLTTLSLHANASTIATDESFIIRGIGGKNIDEENAPEWLEDVLLIQHNAGADIDELNMADYMSEQEYDGKELIFPEGYAGILDALQGNYALHLSENITAIEHSESGVTITSNGIKINFDAVIVTLLLGVLKKQSVKFKPALSIAKQEAINRLGMGTLDKVYLLYDQPFWDLGTTWIATPENGHPKGHFNQWLNLYPYLKKPIIVAFNGGTPAIELSGLADKEIVQQAHQALYSAYF